jgi:hypothetical protein
MGKAVEKLFLDDLFAQGIIQMPREGDSQPNFKKGQT